MVGRRVGIPEKHGSFASMIPRIRYPRAIGLVLFVGGVMFSLVSWLQFTNEGQYWLLGILLGPLATLGGLWHICIGQPWDDKANRMKQWASVGDAIVMGSGVAISGIIVYQHDDVRDATGLILALVIGGVVAWYRYRLYRYRTSSR